MLGYELVTFRLQAVNFTALGRCVFAERLSLGKQFETGEDIPSVILTGL